MEVSTLKTALQGQLHHAFPSVFGVDIAINPKNITQFLIHVIVLFLRFQNADFDLRLYIIVLLMTLLLM